jgi:hypothetical protein
MLGFVRLLNGTPEHLNNFNRLGHISLFMQGYDKFEIADTKLTYSHGSHTSAHTYIGASPRQAGRSDYLPNLPPGNEGQLG